MGDRRRRRNHIHPRVRALASLTCLSLVASLLAAAPAGAAPPDADLASAAGRAAPESPDDVIQADLAQALADKGSADFFVDFADEADLSAAATVTDWTERGAAVVEALQATAETSQADVRKLLDHAELSHTDFWVSNTILVRGGSAELATELAARNQVESLHAPATFEIPEPEPGPDAEAVDAVGWGIDRIRANQVWTTFGVRGEDVVVGNIDSGVAFDHPALAAQYRGNSAGTVSHDYNWFDPSRVCPSPAPCDNNDHGTHTMGTMVGDDHGANQIGVAPAARWIAAKGCETTTCSEAALLASGQWMLAPTRLDGTGADPAQRPHIINNSWGGTRTEPFYRSTIVAWRAAGMFPAFSAGNGGPACGSAGNPGNDEQAYASGSFDINNAIANTSGRGAAAGPVKPNLAAPGVTVRSSVRNGGYASFSGTSMASPHTAGTVALMWSASPVLRGDVAGTIALLDQTAVDTADLTCGGTPGNNKVWGEGKLDAFAAVTQSPRTPVGTLTGVVTDAASGAPIVGVDVQATGEYERSASSGPDGSYTLILPGGNYTVTASAFGYPPIEIAVTVVAGETATQDLALTAAPAGAFTGAVTSAAGPVFGATVTIQGTPIAPAVTDATGAFAFAAVPFGTYRVAVSGGGCFASTTVDLTVDGDESLNVTLPQRTDTFGYTCRPESGGYVEGLDPVDLAGDDAATSVNLPFPFFFYGAQYGRAFVSTNGHVNFLTASTALSNGALPAVGAPNAAIYPLWDDIDMRAAGRVYTRSWGVAPDRSFVIEWRGVPFYLSPALVVDFQVQLNEDGSIVTRYRNLGPDPRERGSSATVGIENATGTVALQYSLNEAVLSDDRSIRFVPPPTGIVSGTLTDANDGEPIAGATVRALQGTTVVSTATTDAAGDYRIRLIPGAYTVEAAKINYVGATAAAPLETAGQTVDRDFTLATAAAQLGVGSLSFLANTDQLRTARLTLANPSTSGITLTYTLTDGQSWLWTVPAAGSVAPGTSKTLTVRADPTDLAGGVHPGLITITTNAGRAPSIALPVAMVVPEYRQGVNAGGASYNDTEGDPWAADGAWSPGGSGYVGAGWTVTTTQPIAGTEDDALHQTSREATSGYRFDNLPAGTYVVELDVTESRGALAPGRRVFDVWVNGGLVLPNYDPVAAVGTLALDEHEFTVEVAAGGAIAVDFGAKRGKLPPIVSAVRITHRPDL